MSVRNNIRFILMCTHLSLHMVGTESLDMHDVACGWVSDELTTVRRAYDCLGVQCLFSVRASVSLRVLAVRKEELHASAADEMSRIVVCGSVKVVTVFWPFGAIGPEMPFEIAVFAPEGRHQTDIELPFIGLRGHAVRNSCPASPRQLSATGGQSVEDRCHRCCLF